MKENVEILIFSIRLHVTPFGSRNSPVIILFTGHAAITDSRNAR